MRRKGVGLPDVGVLLAHTNHDTLMTWTTDDGSVGHINDWKGFPDARIRTGKQHGERHHLRTRSADRRRDNCDSRLTSNWKGLSANGRVEESQKKVLTAGFAHSGTVVNNLMIHEVGLFSCRTRVLTRAATSSSMAIGYSLVR